VLERLQQAAPVRATFATLLEPASEFGRAALDELHQQTMSLLSFQGLPRAFTTRRRPITCSPGWARPPKSAWARSRRGFAAITPRSPPAAGPHWPLQVVHAPVFHGHTFSIAVELERPAEIAAVEEALSGGHLDLVLEDTDSPSNLAATGQNDVLVRLRPELDARNSSQISRLWLWAASDTCGYRRRTRLPAPWTSAGCGRKGRCSKP